MNSDNETDDDNGADSDSSEELVDADEKQRQIGPGLWKNVQMRNVEELPENISGLPAYQIDNVDKNTMVTALKDGRKWKKIALRNGRDMQDFVMLIAKVHMLVKMTAVHIKNITESQTTLSLTKTVTVKHVVREGTTLSVKRGGT